MSSLSPPDASTKRIRWATKRLKGNPGSQKRQSLMYRFQHRHEPSGDSNSKHESGSDVPDDLIKSTVSDDQPIDSENDRRRIFFNIPLPPEELDEEGLPKATYARNKIRTAKYTPLSFIPKDLYFQFHNVANVYFLFIIILGAFSIFGVVNPALNAVPLIVILTVTGIKDAIEDWRRTVLDRELNNAPIHRLVDYHNVNTGDDSISLWRRIKKASTRAVSSLWHLWKDRKDRGNPNAGANGSLKDSRPSIDTRRASYTSTRSSIDQISDDGIPMTPFDGPPVRQHETPGKSSSSPYDEQPASGHAKPSEKRNTNASNTKKAYGSLVNPFKEISNKARFKKDYWKNVKVGDYLRLYSGEEVPADVVVLSTSESDGACYVETKNLDGETNLKVRQALHCGRKVRHARHCEQAEFVIESEGPLPNLYAFNGVARWTQHDPHDPEGFGTSMAEPISINNLLLRGSTLRNTEWALGVVIFTGAETKIMLNSGVTPSKRAMLSKDLNWNVLYNFIILFLMCLIAGIVEGISWSQGGRSQNYFEYGSYGGTAALNGLITFWAGVILFQNLIPISLYITLEIIRTLQAIFIYSDVEMYYEPLDYPCTPKTWNISDDLGQIEYVFSDKTGTLTQNVMEFKKATVNGVPYGEAYTEAQAGLQRRQGLNVQEESEKALAQIAEDKTKMVARIKELHDNPYLCESDLTFVAPDFIGDLAGDSGDEQRAATEEFMLALALCHTVIVERIPGDPPTIDFKAQSPDEAALVATAKDCGFTFIGRSDDSLTVNIMGVERTFVILNILEFNSARKRMSAIVRMPDGRIILYCKGADSMIYSRLRSGEQTELRQTTAQHLEMFAREGLRTLCIAKRELDPKEYDEWNKLHEVAAASITDREEKLEEVSDSIERNLLLLGGTAIEDRLQDGVPESIALLGKAGIKLWVLTGDKVETAINIGFSCNLLDNDMELILLNIENGNLETAKAELDKHLNNFGISGSEEELKEARTNHEPPPATHAVVIDGESLKLMLDPSLKRKFLLLCKNCRSILCCRVSPAQKAQVVGLVKNNLDCLTLAIGDGANDVAMIQEAHVGVGIVGEEGRQAAMSSDFAIGQFRYLTRLILVHGRWSYRRLAESISNFFYKNVIWTFALFWYNIYATFDCPNVFDYTYIILYNLAFTSLPVICMGVLDQDVVDKISLAVPQLYRRGIERKEWTPFKFWLYMFDGLYQSVLVFYFAYLVFWQGRPATDNGLVIADTERMGVYIATAAVIVCNIYVLMNIYRWDWLTLIIVIISILLIFFWTGVYTASTYSQIFYEAASQVYGQPSFWAMISMTTVVCLLPRFVAKYIQKLYYPRDIDIIREQVSQGKFDYLKDNTDYFPPCADESIFSDNVAPDYSMHKTPTRKSEDQSMPDDMRPIYPPSIARTAATHTRSPNGSDGTDYTDNMRNELSVDLFPSHRLSTERPRPSFDRARLSMDPVRRSFEASNDFTSAAMLSRMEASRT